MLSWVINYRYFIIFPLAIVEGPILMVASGFLLRLGYFDFLPLYFVLMAGDLTADVLWYGVGYYWGYSFIRKFGKFFSITEELIDKIKNLFHQYHNKILFISKITMGFGFALVTLITAGMVKIPFKKYFLFNALGQFIWTGFLMALGYFFGDLYAKINHVFNLIYLIALLITLAAALYGLRRYFRKKLTAI